MGKYKGNTPARAKASEKYLTEKVDSIMVRVPHGKKEELREAAAVSGISLNKYCADAILDRLRADQEDLRADRANQEDLRDEIQQGHV